MKDDRDDLESSMHAGPTRRRLLGAAAGGFALAASGLFLPEVMTEAEARGGALDGVLGGRHGKRNRGHRRRNLGNNHKHRGGRPRGEKDFLGVALSLFNWRQAAISVREWTLIDSDVIAWTSKLGWQTIDGKPATGPEHSIDFIEDGLQLAVELGTGHIIQVGNPYIGFPWITIGAGGWSADGWNPRGTTLIDKGFSVGETGAAPGFHAQRLPDDADHKRFIINLI